MTPWGGIIGAVGEVIDDLVTTEEERAAIELKREELTVGLMQGQINTNIEEAKHPSVFVAGWRPWTGWVVSTALGLTFIPKALVITGIWTYQCIVIVGQWNGAAPAPALPEFPELGVADLIGLLGALLGMGAIRSYDKQQGKDTRRVER